MKVHSVLKRSNYIETQVDRSRKKFSYCKVSARDPLLFYHTIRRYLRQQKAVPQLGPVLCLGVRNGREVDLFRIALSNPWLANLIAATEIAVQGRKSPLDWLATLNRSDHRQIRSRSVIGVEINPDAARKDILTESFDTLPLDWQDSFGVVYSNSFDQAQDPHRTAREWLRITKPGGFLLIAFGIQKEPSLTDPVGGLCLSDILKLFPGKTVYFNASGTFYAEAIIQKPLRHVT